MLFIRHENLKVGMRLAKPIYDKKGVLLYDRDSKLTIQGIESVHNFGIIGLYILEPAEPVPPMTQEDIEFERFQMMSTFTIADEWTAIRKGKKAEALNSLVTQINKSYGHLNHKFNFVQSLRSEENKYYKHCLNVAILCALTAHKMNIKVTEQTDLITAALIHDIGKLDIPKALSQKKESEMTDEEKESISVAEAQGNKYVGTAFPSMPGLKKIINQSYHQLYAARSGNPDRSAKLIITAKILMAADTFDTMTAMNDYREPSSEITAIRYLLNNPDIFDSKVTQALIDSINILIPGSTVELTNGEKGLVITENTKNVLKPVVLCFSDNKVIDLGMERIYGDLDIKDVMKTMDNRCIIDRSTLESMGFKI